MKKFRYLVDTSLKWVAEINNTLTFTYIGRDDTNTIRQTIYYCVDAEDYIVSVTVIFNGVQYKYDDVDNIEDFKLFLDWFYVENEF